jgi:hypothetical protein
MEAAGPDYPAACLRGIRSSKWIVPGPDGSVLAAAAYEFDLSARTGLPREGWREVSVNWEDDESAEDFTRNQKNAKGRLHQHGVGRLAVADIERCAALIRLPDRLVYERRPDPDQPGNPYHGNLLLDPSVPLQFQRQLAGALGLVTRVAP